MSPIGPVRVAAIIPVGVLEDSKSRLGGALDAEERLDLASQLLHRTVAACLETPGLADVLVISPDRSVLRKAAELGARTLRQRSMGLNAGLAEARDDVVAGGAETVVILPIDLPFISAETITGLLSPFEPNDPGPLVVLVSDRSGTGTNALALRPPDIIPFCFGPTSREAHRSAAEHAGARYVEVDGALNFDIDTPADLVAVQSVGAEERHAG